MKKILSLTVVLLLLCMMTLPAFGAENSGFVFDDAGLLTESEELRLQEKAALIAGQYQCGMYIMTVEDYTDYGSGDVFETTYGIYHSRNLGIGSSRSGLILLLSMRERDYALFVYGEAEYAFNGHGQILLEEEFLDDFGDDRWYDGFSDYLTTGEEFLALAADGNPVRESPVPMTILLIVIACVIAFIVVAGIWNSTKKVRRQSGAMHYVTGKGLELTRQTDVYTHRTRVVTKIQSSSSGSRSGGGGSGRSGKF